MENALTPQPIVFLYHVHSFYNFAQWGVIMEYLFKTMAALGALAVSPTRLESAIQPKQVLPQPIVLCIPVLCKVLQAIALRRLPWVPLWMQMVVGCVLVV